ncbi:MAG: SGNH/GDSL hydrolase family protein [Thermoleophilaceae bacterium]
MLVALAAPLGLLLLLAVEATLAMRGEGVPFEEPPRTAERLGRGPALSYVVLGDSTGAGQGAPYRSGVAVSTAQSLARGRRVSLLNLAVSGATTADVLAEQVEPAARARPDLVLLAVGANDVTHLTTSARLRGDLLAIVERLRPSGCAPAVVVTGSPEVGVVPRLAQPLRLAARVRTARVNEVFAAVARERGLVFAPVARETGPLFGRDPSLFAADRFHPNARGYATWVPVIDRALADALRQGAGGRCP